MKALLEEVEYKPRDVDEKGEGTDCSLIPNKSDLESKDERETWDKKVEFLLAVIGFAVDLGNVWRFPYICHKNGGGAFLIPYTIMLLFGGLPLFYFELALGQYHRSGILTVWQKICPLLKGVGYAVCMLDFYMALYYNTIISWALYYLFSSFRSELPWTTCSNEWNTPNCTLVTHIMNTTDYAGITTPAQEFFERSVLEINKADGIDYIGPVKWSLALCLLFVFLLVYFSIWKGVKSTGKAVWITALGPYVVLVILLIRGVTLPGSLIGIRYYLEPKWEKLATLEVRIVRFLLIARVRSKVWTDAAAQIFFSLGPGFGTLLALSSYNRFHNNCFRDAILTSTINCLTSFVSGFVIFSVLGYMAHVQHKEIEEVADEGPGLVFVVYPEAIATMKGSIFWSIVFFFMLITLGLDSTFGGLEAIITGLCDEYPHRLGKHREIFVICLIGVIYLCALPTTTYGGIYIVTLLNEYGPSISILFVVFVESITVSWFYGVSKFADDIRKMLGSRPGWYWIICWAFISPVFIFFIFVCTLLFKPILTQGSYIFPDWANTVGWTLTASSLVMIPTYMLYCISISPGNTFTEKLKASVKPRSVDIVLAEEIVVLNSLVDSVTSTAV